MLSLRGTGNVLLLQVEPRHLRERDAARLGAVAHKPLVLGGIYTYVHGFPCPTAQIDQLLSSRSERVRILLPGREREKVALAYLLFFRLGLSLLLNDKSRPSLARLEDVEPLLIMNVPVHGRGCGARLYVNEVYALFG